VSGELRYGHDHADHDEHDDRDLHPYPGGRHDLIQTTAGEPAHGGTGLSYARYMLAPKARMSARRAALLCLAALLVLGTFSAVSASAAASKETAARTSASVALMGVTLDGIVENPDPEIAAARALHASVVRVEVPWSKLEPRGAGQLAPGALAETDRTLAAAAAARLKVIMLVDSTPCWSSSAPASILRGCSDSRATRANAWPPRHTSDFAAFTAYLATRYAPDLAGIEIWNEPDQSNELYLAGPHKPQRYADMLRAAYSAIKAVAPQVKVLAGSLVGSNGVFLRALYAAGIKGYYDGLSVHFYNLVLASLRSIHEVQIANGDTEPLWLDEFGWTSCWPRRHVEQEQGCVTAQTQAANITNTYRALARLPYMAAVVLYKLRDSAGEDFGVLSARGARKPSFAALAQQFADPFGALSPVTLSLHRAGTSVIASGGGPVGDFMELQAFQGASLRYRALFTLDRFNRYSLTLPAVLGTSGLAVRVFQYWSGPGRGVEQSI